MRETRPARRGRPTNRSTIAVAVEVGGATQLADDSRRSGSTAVGARERALAVVA
jgi:hypothetical protein